VIEDPWPAGKVTIVVGHFANCEIRTWSAEAGSFSFSSAKFISPSDDRGACRKKSGSYAAAVQGCFASRKKLRRLGRLI
jgi:hypothetical protein